MDQEQQITWLTRQEVADHLRVSIPTISRWIRDGRLIGYKSGERNSTMRFKLHEVNAVLKPADPGDV